jgi:hypothetical protein
LLIGAVAPGVLLKFATCVTTGVSKLYNKDIFTNA